MERSQNRRTGDREERQDFINLDESEWQELLGMSSILQPL